MDFFGWKIELEKDIIPYRNDELRKAVFVKGQDGYSIISGEISLNDQDQLVWNLYDFKGTFLGEKHLLIEVREGLAM